MTDIHRYLFIAATSVFNAFRIDVTEPIRGGLGKHILLLPVRSRLLHAYGVRLPLKGSGAGVPRIGRRRVGKFEA